MFRIDVRWLRVPADVIREPPRRALRRRASRADFCAEGAPSNVGRIFWEIGRFYEHPLAAVQSLQYCRDLLRQMA
jgi:hypothetical protein